VEEERLKEIVQQWLLKADRDLEIVGRDLLNAEPLTDILSFHCQQAVEKYLKAFLVSRLVKPPKTHEISELVLLCTQLDAEFKIMGDIFYLSDFAIEIRYPDEFIFPEVEQVKKALLDAKRVHDLVKRKTVI
jgi:HEPN domain-containing protein